jgi:hypothetical protein
MTHTTDPEMQGCIDTCTKCHQTCLHEAMNHCLEEGGEHVAPDHFRLMMNCAEMCQTSANFMLSGSALSTQVCRVCAEICDACAQSCEEIEGMEECARVCRECAESCRRMSGSGATAAANAQERVPAEEL